MTHAVLAFGRMNPPTTGHEKFIKKTHEIAKKVGGKAHVIASHSEGNAKNPIPQKKKLEYIKKVAHKDVHVSGSSKEHPSILHHASKLHAAGHQHLHVVAAGEREAEFHKTLHKYNGKSGAHGHYNFKSITVHSAGKRDPDAHGTTGISGTKMRQHAHNNDHESFKKGLPKALHPHKDEIMHHIKSVNESVDESFAEFIEEEFVFEAMNLQQRIKRRLIMRRIRPKLKRAKRLFKTRRVPEKNIQQRSRKKAIRAVRKRVAGKMGQNYQKLSAAAKMFVDKRVKSRQNIVNRLAKKAMPTTRKSELYRLTKSRVRESFEMFLEANGYVGSYGSARKTTTAGTSTFKGAGRVKGQKGGEASWSGPAPRKRKPLPGSHKVGQKVKVNVGAHKGHDHLVTKDHGDGTYNVRPIGGVGNKYKGGQARAASYHLTTSESIIQVGEADKAKLTVTGAPIARKNNPTKATKTKHEYKKVTAKGGEAKPVSEQDIHNLYLKAEKGGYPLEIVLEVFIRGVEANLYEQQTPTQNGFGRVNSFIAKGKAYELDHDLVEKMGFDTHTDVVAAAANKKKDKASNPYMKLEGTPEAAAHARKVTPGQVNEADRMKMVNDRIAKEKERDKMKHDRMRDRARMRDTINKNRMTETTELPDGTEKKLTKMAKSLKKSSKGHAKQADYIEKVVKKDQQNENKAMGDLLKAIDKLKTPEARKERAAELHKMRMDDEGFKKSRFYSRMKKESVDDQFENFVSMGTGVSPLPQTRPRKMVAKKKVEEVHQGKTHMQGYIDRRSKGIKSKPIDKDRFFGKKKAKPEDKEKPLPTVAYT